MASLLIRFGELEQALVDYYAIVGCLVFHLGLENFCDLLKEK